MDISAVRADDKAAWRPLWQAYLDFYNQPLPEAVTDLTFARFLDPAEPMFMYVARLGGEMAGFATGVPHRSTWAHEGYCYLEDLYVAKNARSRGVARALIEAVSKAAKQRGLARLYWVTHDHNEQARALYDKVAERTQFVQYQKAL
jgi:GNAT superfamily N-acetyltransferase